MPRCNKKRFVSDLPKISVLILSSLVLFGIALGPAAFAVSENQPGFPDWFAEFQSSVFSAAKPLADSQKDQLFIFRWLNRLTDFSYDPGLKNDPVDGDCRFRNFKMQRLAQDPAPAAHNLSREYLDACEDRITTGTKTVLGNMYRTLQIHYPLEDNPYIKRVVLNLPGNVKLPGLVAIKDAVHPRPWVILRAGIFGNSVDLHAERFLVIQLFEQGPFNLLFLDSSTSPETIRLNDRQSVGGLDEGLQTYQVAERLKAPDEPLHRLVTDIHLLAISMGGHGMMMTMLLDQLNTSLITSAVGLCPLLQFNKTMERHESQTSYGPFMNFWAWKRLKPLREKYDGISMGHALHDAFQYVRENYKGPLSNEPRLKWPKDLDLKTFDAANDLFPLLGAIKKPVHILASAQDMLVPFELNSGVLQARKQNGEFPNFEITKLKESYHCTLPGPYSWDEMSNLLMAQFSGLEESYKRDFVWHESELPAMEISGAIATRLEFEVKTGDTELRTRVGGQTILIPIDALGWATVGHVRSDVEALLLTRWARFNIELTIGEDGHPKLRWRVPKPLLETASR